MASSRIPLRAGQDPVNLILAEYIYADDLVREPAVYILRRFSDAAVPAALVPAMLVPAALLLAVSFPAGPALFPRPCRIIPAGKDAGRRRCPSDRILPGQHLCLNSQISRRVQYLSCIYIPDQQLSLHGLYPPICKLSVWITVHSNLYGIVSPLSARLMR